MKSFIHEIRRRFKQSDSSFDARRLLRRSSLFKYQLPDFNQARRAAMPPSGQAQGKQSAGPQQPALAVPKPRP